MFDAVLVVSFGGPQGPDDIRPFLANVLRGRRVAPGRVEEVAHHYELFGGVSPITGITKRQAAGLEARLRDAGQPLPVYVGMRNWHPFLTDTLRDRTVGLVGMGRIGQAIARRIEAFGVPVVYHSRTQQQGVKYKYYPRLIDMARDVDTLLAIVPGGASTQNMINKDVLEALGPRGILINMARGSVVDE